MSTFSNKYALLTYVFEDLDDYQNFYNRSITIKLVNDETTCLVTLKNRGSFYEYHLGWMETGKSLGDYVKKFEPTQENLNAFHKGCAKVAGLLERYLDGESFESLSEEPAPFGELTHTS